MKENEKKKYFEMLLFYINFSEVSDQRISYVQAKNSFHIEDSQRNR